MPVDELMSSTRSVRARAEVDDDDDDDAMLDVMWCVFLYTTCLSTACRMFFTSHLALAHYSQRCGVIYPTIAFENGSHYICRPTQLCHQQHHDDDDNGHSMK